MDRNDYSRLTDDELDRRLREVQDRQKRVCSVDVELTDSFAIQEITAVIDERRNRKVIGAHQDTTGFGPFSGIIYENRVGDRRDGWYYVMGSAAARGPFPSKNDATADRDIRLAKLTGKRK